MTEKNYNPKQKERRSMEKPKKIEQGKSPESLKKTEKPKETTEKIKENKKGKKPEIKKPKKIEAVVKAKNLPISTKDSAAICKFIKNKKIEQAINDLEQVLIKKRAVPMKGEIPHRHGKGMMSGRFPRKGSQSFIKLLKSLSANANYNEIEDPIITEAISNIGKRPYGKFGRVRKKRTHVKIIAKSKIKNKEKTA